MVTDRLVARRAMTLEYLPADLGIARRRNLGTIMGMIDGLPLSLPPSQQLQCLRLVLCIVRATQPFQS